MIIDGHTGGQKSKVNFLKREDSTKRLCFVKKNTQKIFVFDEILKVLEARPSI